MFTGWIDHCGRVSGLETQGDGRRLYIETQYSHISIGESVSIDGICLTVTSFTTSPSGLIICDLSPETLLLTHAMQLQKGSLVNLERALMVNDRLHGHFVMGHVDQTAVIQSRTDYDGYVALQIGNLLEEAYPLLVNKGSITVNGVSLTINKVHEDSFEVMLIPETLKRTNLNELKPQDVVNIEYDYLAKLIARQQELRKLNS